MNASAAVLKHNKLDDEELRRRDEDKQRQAQLDQHLQQYRESLARLQQLHPGGVVNMPGVNPEELAEREKSIVEAMGSVSYSKRYSDARFEYR